MEKIDFYFNQHIKYMLVMYFKDGRRSPSVQTFLNLKDCEDTIEYNKHVLFSAYVYELTGKKQDVFFGGNLNSFD